MTAAAGGDGRARPHRFRDHLGSRDGDHGLAAGVPLLHVPDARGRVGQRVRPVDHRSEPAGPDELYAQAAEVYELKALATLMFVIGQVSFFVPIALIAKPVPGRAFNAPWK